MPTPKNQKKKERPVTHHQDTGTPKTTEAVHEDIIPKIRLGLRATPPEIPSGAVVEIDLFGEGLDAIYSSMLARTGPSDEENVIDAADKMVRVLHDLDTAQARNQNRHHVDYWTLLISRLHKVEDHLSHSGVDGTAPLGVLVGEANHRIIVALRDGIELGAPTWKGARALLHSVGCSCLELAEKVEHGLREKLSDRHEEPLTFAPLSEGPEPYSNAEDLSTGLAVAARLGIDLNDIEIGRCSGEQVARVIRGKVL